MANNTLNTRIIVCSKTSAEWASNTTVILKGEFAIEFTGSTPKIKIGNGVDTFKDLPYLTNTPQEITDLINAAVSQSHTHSNQNILDAITAAFTTELLAKLNGIEEGANKTIVDSALSDTSTNPVQNKIIKSELDTKVPNTRKINGKSLSTDITLSAGDVGADVSGAAANALSSANQYTDTEIDKAKKYTDKKVADLVDSAPETMDTLKELADAIEAHQDVTDALNAAIGNKVDKVEGKGLSTNDLTNDLKSKYDAAYAHSQSSHAPSNAERNTIVGIKKNGTDIQIDPETRKVDIIIPTKVSDLSNDSKFISKVDIQGAVTGTGTGSVINATAVNAVNLYLNSSDVLILDGGF